MCVCVCVRASQVRGDVRGGGELHRAQSCREKLSLHSTRTHLQEQTKTLDEKMALGLVVWFIRETLSSTGTSEQDGIL